MGNPNPPQNTNSHFKMLLFTDVVTKDELLTDAYDPKEVDGVVYEVDCAMITIKDGDVDIGANASAEEASEALEDGAQQVINAVHTFRLQSTSFAKKIVGNFKDYEFYTGESMDPDGMVVLLNYREDGTTPYLIYWKHGLKEEKI